MAIDTRDKRASTVAGLIVFFAVSAVPDGTIDGLDNQQIMGVYRGIPAGEPFVPPEVPPSLVRQALIDAGPDIDRALIRTDITVTRAVMRRVQ